LVLITTNSSLYLKRVAECAGKVLLVPGSAGRAKYWLLAIGLSWQHYWRTTGWVCVIGQPDKSDIVAELIGSAHLPHLPRLL
jgi:hypothetical protein